MPYIDLLHPSDAVSIWYTSSSRLGTVNSLHPDKPTIVMLHPLYLNSSWLWAQMDDPRLNSTYNIIAFDTRTSGKSMSAPSGMYDTWVQAADLALCFQVCVYSRLPRSARAKHLCSYRSLPREQYLHLPSVHLVGIETVSVNCAQRFAILYAFHLTPFRQFHRLNPIPARFPEMVLSLTLINVPPPTEYESRAHAPRTGLINFLFCRLKTTLCMLDELIQLYGYAEDLDTCEHAAKELSAFLAGPVSLTAIIEHGFLTESDRAYRVVREICWTMYVIQLLPLMKQPSQR